MNYRNTEDGLIYIDCYDKEKLLRVLRRWKYNQRQKTEARSCQGERINPNIPLEEYFTYHSPKTSETKQKHGAINKNCCDLFIAYKDTFDGAIGLEKGQEKIGYLRNRLVSNIKYLIEDDFSREWALETLELLDRSLGLEDVLKVIQTVRMASNQGITIDEVATDY